MGTKTKPLGLAWPTSAQSGSEAIPGDWKTVLSAGPPGDPGFPSPSARVSDTLLAHTLLLLRPRCPSPESHSLWGQCSRLWLPQVPLLGSGPVLVFPLDFLFEVGFAIKELKLIAYSPTDRHRFFRCLENVGRNCHHRMFFSGLSLNWCPLGRRVWRPLLANIPGGIHT